jgi:nitrate reductase gamma subunit
VDDFDVSGPASAAPAAAPLTDLSIAYALLTYFAFFVLALGLAIQTIRLLRQIAEVPPKPGEGGTLLRLFRAGTDVVLLRSTFFADRWAWIFGLCFHVGLLLIVLRHLRYFLDAAWVGPLWYLVELAQPFGFYGGALLPLGAAAWYGRQIVLDEHRLIHNKTDHWVMILLIAIPVVGYANTLVHTDVVAVKDFTVGLMTFHWTNLPADPLLLLHLWLFALLLMLLPFSRLLLLLPLGNLLEGSFTALSGRRQSERRAMRYIVPIVATALIACAGVVVRHGVTDGFHPPKVDMANIVAAHRTADATVMIRNHPKFLFNHRTIVMHTGVGEANDNIERCVTCHAVKDANGQPVGFDNPTHYCRACHTKAAVTIDCFECHTSKPVPEGQSALPPHSLFALVLPSSRPAAMPTNPHKETAGP